MRREREARHSGGGWFRLRRRVRWIGVPVLLGLALVLGGGMLRGLWDRFTMWLWQTTHLVPTTVVGAVVIAVMLALLCRASRLPPADHRLRGQRRSGIRVSALGPFARA